MKTRGFRILGAVLAVLLPACGGDGEGSGTEKPKKAFGVTLRSPKAGKTYTAPATISLSAVVADPASVAKVEFVEGASRGAPNTWVGGNVVATLTQPPFKATWADAPAGIHTLVAVATDSQGVQTFSSTVTISVLGPGEHPGGWVPITMLWSGPGKIWFVDARRGWVAGLGIHHTVDGGATWVAQLDTPGGVFDIQFVDAKRGWAIGGRASGTTVLRTTDGGETWTPSSVGSDPPFFGGSVSFVDSDTGWIVGGGPGENIFVTKDGGVTWTPQPTGFPGVFSFSAVQFVDAHNGWVLGNDSAFSSVILHTTDGGLTWTEIRPDPGEGFIAMDFVSARKGWVSVAGPSESGRILITNDGGATWTEQSSTDTGPISELVFVSPTQGWGKRHPPGVHMIVHTEDGGVTWETQFQSSGVPLDIGRFINANVGWAMQVDGTLLKTKTGGKAP